MALQNLPAALQQVLQGNWLNRQFEEQLASHAAYRVSASRHAVPTRSGETVIYSKAGRIVPSIQDLNPALNVGLDNNFPTPVGGVGATNSYSFEQWQVFIGAIGKPLDINAVQQQQAIDDLFKQNWDNLAENASLSLDLKAAQATFLAYESGRTYATAGVTGSTTVHVDNIKGLDTAFNTLTIDGNVMPVGSPQQVSSTNTLAATVYPASNATPYSVTITGTVQDGSNTSTAVAGQMVNGISGTLTFSAAQTLATGDVIMAFDAPAYLRPNNKRSRLAMTTSDTAGMQLVINAKSILGANGIKPFADGTFLCIIDPLVTPQFFTDPQFQIASQGAIESKLFKNGKVYQHWGVTFVETTNSPVYGPFANAANTQIYTRRMIVVGQGYLWECPFEGMAAGYESIADMAVADIRIMKDVAVITQPPIDRQSQILRQSWLWTGGFVAQTDATITPAVVPSATPARLKRAVVIECGTSF